MWIIMIVACIAIFGLIRGSKLSSGSFQVINKDKVPFHIGSYADCRDYAKIQNQYCKTFGIKDHFKVVSYKL